MRDLPALWSEPAWRAGLEAWLLPALADAGLTVTGPLVTDRIRFWSVVLQVETDAGRVWVKENAPSQAFEAGLVAAVERLAPGRMAPVVAVAPDRGWLATLDVGTPLRAHEDVGDDDWVELLTVWASLQRDLEPHGDALQATGLSTFPEAAAAAWVADLADTLHALPADHPRHLAADERAAVESGLARVTAAGAELAASGIPASLQHNDLHLGNAFRRPGAGMAFIDLGDALWTHPLAVARIPRWVLAHERTGPVDSLVRRATDAYLEAWTDRMPLADLRALLPAAERLSAVHRAVSWARLVDDVPVEVVDGESVRSVPDWLLIATAPDPYAYAVAL